MEPTEAMNEPVQGLRPTSQEIRGGTLSDQPHGDDHDLPRRGITARKQNVKCRFFTSKKGCRLGESCPYVHDISLVKQPDQENTWRSAKPEKTAEFNTQQDAVGQRSEGSARALRDRGPIAKPISKSQLDNPREFQINQLQKRFSPQEETRADGLDFRIRLQPTDPDFPFDLDALICSLHVPSGYPTPSARPSIKVENPGMDKGYQINVEKGFDSLISKFPTKTLLGLMNELDKNLESFLSRERAPTIKLLSNAPRQAKLKGAQIASKAIPSAVANSLVPEVNELRISADPTFSEQQVNEARVKRTSEIRQLEARLGKQALFSKSRDGNSFTVPIQFRASEDLPSLLQLVKTVRLVVPVTYHLEPCVLNLDLEGDDETRIAEEAFKNEATWHPERSLLAHLNYFAQHAAALIAGQKSKSSRELQEHHDLQQEAFANEIHVANQTNKNSEPSVLDRPHVQFVPRPPEWTLFGDASEDSSDSHDSEELSEDDGDGGAPISEEMFESTPERGIMLSFPQMELYGIELLELTLLSVTIKCDRCKESKDLKNIKPFKSSDRSNVREESCSKCANMMSVGFRSDLMHTNSVRAGFLDLDGCTISDLLPSNFVPHCSECSNAYDSPGVVSVRGESTLAICRTCHRKMNFKLPEVKFLLLSNTGVNKNRPLARKKPKENLGITAGHELPRRGRCVHYSKSHRWFRFSCCSKVFPCDKCHDEASEHPNEHANRMICGFCSREQPYRPEDCIHCHSVLVGKKGSGFWEGGKGTRDKIRMSRKDPRKYKRRA